MGKYVLKLKRVSDKPDHKYCTKCNIELPFTAFKPNKNIKSGLSSWCYECSKTYYAERYGKKRIPRGREGHRVCRNCKQEKLATTEFFHRSDRNKIGLDSFCRECRNDRGRQWKKKNSERYHASARAYYARNRDKISAWAVVYFKKRRKTDPSFRAMQNLRRRVRELLKSSRIHKHSFTIGCTPTELKKHLESQFLPGMTWENYGIKGWHIDHIYPIAMAAKDSPEILKRSCHYTNLRPMWAKDNLKKSDSVITCPPSDDLSFDLKEKTCTKCLKLLDKSLFYLDNSNHDKLSYQCKPCIRAKYGWKERVTIPVSKKDNHKYCSKCRTEKPFSEFSRHFKGRHGLASWCRSCCYEHSRIRRLATRGPYKRKPHVKAAKEGHKICRRCESEKPFQDFRSHKNAPYYVCKLCESAAKKAKRDGNPENTR